MWMAICSGPRWIRGRFFRPMPPMPPMRFVCFDLFESVSCNPPLPRRRLAGQNESGHPTVDQFCQIRGLELASATLRVDDRFDVLVEAGHRHRLVPMLPPPHHKQVSNYLPSPVPLLCLADPFGRVFAAKCKQRIAYPRTPLLEATQGLTSRKIPPDPSPAPNGQCRG